MKHSFIQFCEQRWNFSCTTYFLNIQCISSILCITERRLSAEQNMDSTLSLAAFLYFIRIVKMVNLSSSHSGFNRSFHLFKRMTDPAWIEAFNPIDKNGVDVAVVRTLPTVEIVIPTYPIASYRIAEMM